MTLRELDLAGLEDLHRRELREAFPPEELKPFAAMEVLYRTGLYRPVGAFEGEALVGYAILWESPGGAYLLIDYLGVTASRRNGGLGGAILDLLREKFRDLDGIIVESEAPDGGTHDELRNRRMDFYRRNGFDRLDYDSLLFGVHYATFLTSPNGRGDRDAALEAHKALYRRQFSQAAYDRFIQIPRDPAHPLQPPESWAEQTTLPGLEERKEASL